ncbi:MAG: hypothetical protein ACRERD_32245 [Candidatus Binatia bacterium]
MTMRGDCLPPTLAGADNIDEVWQKLTAEENLFQEVQLNALLRSTRTLDIFGVTVVG